MGVWCFDIFLAIVGKMLCVFRVQSVLPLLRKLLSSAIVSSGNLSLLNGTLRLNTHLTKSVNFKLNYWKLKTVHAVTWLSITQDALIFIVNKMYKKIMQTMKKIKNVVRMSGVVNSFVITHPTCHMWSDNC